MKVNYDSFDARTLFRLLKKDGMTEIEIDLKVDGGNHMIIYLPTCKMSQLMKNPTLRKGKFIARLYDKWICYENSDYKERIAEFDDLKDGLAFLVNKSKKYIIGNKDKNNFVRFIKIDQKTIQIKFGQDKKEAYRVQEKQFAEIIASKIGFTVLEVQS